MYTASQAATLVQSLPEVMRAAEEARMLRVSPTVSDRSRALEVVKSVMRARHRKVYGGFAINEQLRRAGVTTTPGDDVDVPDIEFYTPDPVSDLIALCTALYDHHGFRNVQGREVAHRETFGVSVEFVRVCDLTYVPPSVYDFIPVQTMPDSNLLCCAPIFLFIDLLRIVSEPDTSYWRLVKAFPRLVLLDTCFPLIDDPNPPQRASAARTAGEMLADACVIQFLPGRRSLVVVGQAAVDFFDAVPRTCGGSTVAGPPAPLELMSVNFEADVMAFAQWVHVAKTSETFALAAAGSACTITPYQPFLDLMGRSVRLLLGGNPLVPTTTVAVIIYDSVARGVPYVTDVARGLRIGSVHVVAAQLASAQFRAHVENDPAAMPSTAYASQMTRLFAARKRFFEENENDVHTSLLSGNHPFRDLFTGLDNIQDDTRGIAGVTMSAMHMHAQISAFKHRAFGQAMAWYSFDPSRARDRQRMSSGQGAACYFLDTSGMRAVDKRPPSLQKQQQPQKYSQKQAHEQQQQQQHMRHANDRRGRRVDRSQQPQQTVTVMLHPKAPVVEVVV